MGWKGVPTLVHLILPPDADGAGVELVELDTDHGIWGGTRDNMPDAYGTIVKVIAALSGRPTDDQWVREAAAALTRESDWGLNNGWRRPVVEVIQGTGQLFHATAAVNRRSIYSHGLDWQRMSAAPGIAGSRAPELPVIFVCHQEDISFFLQMARSLTDVWAVDVDGLWIETGPSGWWIISQPISPGRLSLVSRDLPALPPW